MYYVKICNKYEYVVVSGLGCVNILGTDNKDFSQNEQKYENKLILYDEVILTQQKK